MDVITKQYPKDQEKYRVATKLKTIRTVNRKACDNGRKSGGGRIEFTFYGLFENLWEGSPEVI